MAESADGGNIIDIVQRLSFEIGNVEGLDTIIKKLQAQADKIDTLQKKVENLNIAYESATGAQEQENIQKAINATTEAINKQTTALQNNFNGNKKLQEALTEELGIIQQLQQFIIQATKERAALTDATEIQRYTQDIKAAQAELRALTTYVPKTTGIIANLNRELGNLRNKKLIATSEAEIAGINKEMTVLQNRVKELNALGTQAANSAAKSGGFLASIFGGGSILRQVVSGTLRGFAIGSGFGIVSRLTDEIIKLGVAYFDTDKRAEEFRETSDKMASAFEKEADTLDKLNQAYRYIEVGSDNTVEGLKRALAIQQAMGTQQGEIYDAQKKQFDVAQALREEEQRSLQGTVDVYTKIKTVIDEIARSVKNGVTNKGPRGNYTIIDSILKRESQGQDRETVDALNNIFLDIKKSGASNFDANSSNGYKSNYLTQAILKAYDDFDRKITEATQKRVDKTNEIEAQRIAFQAKIDEEVYQLQQQLDAKLLIESAKFREQKIKDQEATVENIRKGIAIETNLQLQQLAKEEENQRKRLAPPGGSLPIGIQNAFARQRSLINASAREKELEEIRKYYLDQIQAEEGYQQLFLKNQDTFFKDNLNDKNAFDIDGIRVRAAIIDNERKQQLAANSKEYDDLTIQKEKLQKERREAGLQETAEYKTTEKELQDIYLQSARKEELIFSQSADRKINIYNDFFENLAKVVSEGTKKIEEQENNQLLNADASLAQDFLNRTLSGKRFDYKTAANKILNEIKNAIQDQQNAKNLLPNAYNAFDSTKNLSDQVYANPTSSDADKAKADAALQKSSNEIAAINAKFDAAKVAQAKAEEDLQALRKANIQSQIDMYAGLVETAVQAYQAIAAAHARYLDTEISIQEEKVREAQVLADRGNTTALEQQQKTLQQQQTTRELYARREEQVNAALTVSNALLAVAKAAVEGGGYASIPLIIATIAALAAGYEAAISLSSSSQPPAFKDGVVAFDGEGTGTSDSNIVRISNGESVITAAGTQRNAAVLEAINAGAVFRTGVDPFSMVPSLAESDGFVLSKKDIKELGQKMDVMTQAIEDNRTSVAANVTKDGIYVAHETVAKNERLKWARK